ncbi:MAG TPA: hypothetical protein VHO84_14870 [Syntrophorhabdaceae bacterium]|nr:hypothetical protein [Syntrophorhabdaceae bacterium]
MKRIIRSEAYCIDGLLDVDWAISPIEDMFFIRDAAVNGISREKQMRRLAGNCLVSVDPQFPEKAPGSILVGNRGVGWGHGHDHAALALKAAGIAAVLCETTGTNFRRNCINHGLPILEVPGVFSMVKTGDLLSIDLDSGVVENLSSGLNLRFTPYPEMILNILDAGGIYEKLRTEVESGNVPATGLKEEL